MSLKLVTIVCVIWPLLLNYALCAVTTVRPYKFGFTIDEQQHRAEQKDERGIVMGEFGFITADGIYHVTVYATDENGKFRILSMRSFPYDGQVKIKTAVDRTTTTTKFPLLPASATPAPISKHNYLNEACSGCFLKNKSKQSSSGAKTEIRTLSQELLPLQPTSVVESGIDKTVLAHLGPASLVHNGDTVTPDKQTPTPKKSKQTQISGHASHSAEISMGTVIASLNKLNHVGVTTPGRTPVVGRVTSQVNHSPVHNTQVNYAVGVNAQDRDLPEIIKALAGNRPPVVNYSPLKTTGSIVPITAYSADSSSQTLGVIPHALNKNVPANVNKVPPVDPHKTASPLLGAQVNNFAKDSGFVSPLGFNTYGSIKGAANLHSNRGSPSGITHKDVTLQPNGLGHLVQKTDFTSIPASTTLPTSEISSLPFTHIGQYQNENKISQSADEAAFQLKNTRKQHTPIQTLSQGLTMHITPHNDVPQTQTANSETPKISSRFDKPTTSPTVGKGPSETPTTKTSPTLLTKHVPTDKIAHTKTTGSGPGTSSSKKANTNEGDLYRFKYLLDYNGHEETGGRDGNKQGKYFAIGEDAVERTIEYMANEFGFQPHVSWRKLETAQLPKENALKDYEFVWFNKATEQP